MQKEKQHLITQDIVSKVRWFLEAPDVVIKEDKGGDGKKTWKEKALEDLSNTLNRVKTPFPEAARRGVEFEKTVYDVVASGKEGGSKKFRSVCEELQGFEFYQKGKKTIDVDGMSCFLYAKYDAISHQRREIKDLKTSEKYRAGKFKDSFQHPLYCYISGYPSFKYVLVEWEKYPEIRDVHAEVFHFSDMDQLEHTIRDAIRETFSVLHDLKLWEAYRNSYCLY